MKKILIIIGLFTFCLLTILFMNISFAAQSADNIIRPLFGEKNALFLESIYFRFQDELSFLQYRILGQQALTFSSQIKINSQTANNIDQMDLDQIPVLPHLSTITDEGIWKSILQSLYPGKIIIARTFLRPDPKRPYAIVSLVKMDMKKLAIGVQAGTYYPGGEHKIYGPGFIPKNVQNANGLLVAFNGGFQEKDGHYGMIVGKTTYVPLRNDLATILIHKDGSLQLVDYSGQKLSDDIVAVRQNGPFLIQNGIITSFVEHGLDTWGRTTTNSMYTWRSGLGMTKEGNIIYAVGNSLVPKTLAQALLSAGAINALQLDINPFWVRFFLYQASGNGNYTYFPLLQTMHAGGYQFLHGYNKDFFYIYKK